MCFSGGWWVLFFFNFESIIEFNKFYFLEKTLILIVFTSGETLIFSSFKIKGVLILMLTDNEFNNFYFWGKNWAKWFSGRIYWT